MVGTSSYGCATRTQSANDLNSKSCLPIEDCSIIEQNLIWHKQCSEAEYFEEKAIKMLVEKLSKKENCDELDSLSTAITTKGRQRTKCVTLPRTLNGRITVLGQKRWPHVLYARIWRWPNVKKTDLIHLEFCQYAYDLGKELVCVNPYHYVRFSSSEIDLDGLSIRDEDSTSSVENESLISQAICVQPVNRQRNVNDLSISPPIPFYNDINHYDALNSSSNYYPEQENEIPPIYNDEISSFAGLVPPNQWTFDLPQDVNSNGLISQQRTSKYWCSIDYFELDSQVGETFKVPSSLPNVTIDGYVNLSAGNRFCLGALSNIYRTEPIEKARLHIGKGVQLDLRGEGDVWLTCLSGYSVFVQSYYLDREAGRAPGAAVHKIHPQASIKVFDLRQCYQQVKHQVMAAQLSAVARAGAISGKIRDASIVDSISCENVSVNVDDLRRHCILRLSFVKGWGLDYPRSSIKLTPCWIEIHLHRALQILDEVLLATPINGS